MSHTWLSALCTSEMQLGASPPSPIASALNYLFDRSRVMWHCGIAEGADSSSSSHGDADAAQLTSYHPTACYQAGGEFAMVHTGAAAHVYLETMALDSMESIVRAGERFINTMYVFIPEVLD
ncbi:hypothetical protein BDN67DRAFT_1071489 [Paxillus ammoniavirescens]|nr:hypothetical protein BDN67DRAFT_1071489 [Paxillus ammoniavirescens]